MPWPFRYRKPGYVALNVTDLNRTSDFVHDIVGLERSGEGLKGDRLFRCGTDRHCVLLSQSEQPGFKRAAWDLESEQDVELAYGHFTDLGWSPYWIDQEERTALNLTISPTFRVRDPYTKALFEYYSGMDQTIQPFPARLAKIQRLGHFVINAPDVMRAAKHFTDKFGFVASDYVGNSVALMRAWPNPNHHSFALGPSQTGEVHFNHINFMVSDIDDIGKLQYRLQHHQVKTVFGMGRHPTSDSIFLYFLDPDKMTWEYSFGMEQFPEENPRPPRAMSSRAEDFDVWGAMPDPDFGRIGVIDAATPNVIRSFIG